MAFRLLAIIGLKYCENSATHDTPLPVCSYNRPLRTTLSGLHAGNLRYTPFLPSAISIVNHAAEVFRERLYADEDYLLVIKIPFGGVFGEEYHSTRAAPGYADRPLVSTLA